MVSKLYPRTGGSSPFLRFECPALIPPSPPKKGFKKEITIDLILIEDSRGEKTQGLDDLDLTLHTYKGEHILT